MQDFYKAYTRYADFKGRSDRKEFWLFFLTYIILAAVAGFIDGLAFSSLGFQPLSTIVILGSLIPNIAVAFRRLHDIGKSAWWVLLSLIPLVGTIILIVWYCKKGEPIANAYGEPPLGSLPEPTL